MDKGYANAAIRQGDEDRQNDDYPASFAFRSSICFRAVATPSATAIFSFGLFEPLQSVPMLQTSATR